MTNIIPFPNDNQDNQYVYHDWNGEVIRQRKLDGYFDATAMCKAYGKSWADFTRLSKTQRFIEALRGSMGIPTDILIQVNSTGLNENRGTWIHPKLSIKLAEWLDVEFELLVNEWADQITTKGYAVASPLDGLDFLQYQLNLMKEQQVELFKVKEEVKEVRQLVEVKLNPEAIRQRLNRIVRNVVRETNKGYNTIWSMIYDRLNTNFQADFSRRMNSHNAYVRSAKASGALKRTEGKCYVSLLDFLQHQYPDYLSDMYEIAKEMFEDYLPPDLR